MILIRHLYCCEGEHEKVGRVSPSRIRLHRDRVVGIFFNEWIFSAKLTCDNAIVHRLLAQTTALCSNVSHTVASMTQSMRRQSLRKKKKRRRQEQRLVPTQQQPSKK